MATESDKLVVIGRITTVFGVKGWVKIHSYTESVDSFLHYPNYYLEQSGQWQRIEFEQIKRHHKGLVGLVKDIDDRDVAKQQLCQRDIAVAVGDMQTLEQGEFYWYELEGLEVWADSDNSESLLLGKLDHLFETGANDVLVVKPCDGSIDMRERLIPYLPEQVIKNIDMQAGEIRVEWDPDF